MRTAKVWQFGTLCFLLLLFPGAPAARAQLCNGSWTFGDDGFGAYRLEALEPCRVHLDALGRENPTLPLEVGRRYQVRVVHYAAYPLEVIAKGASVAQDKVLLSMGSGAGTFASDPEVNWHDDGQGTVRFTLTARLFRAMGEGGLIPGYRCRAQAATMRGDFIVMWMPPSGGPRPRKRGTGESSFAPANGRDEPRNRSRVTILFPFTIARPLGTVPRSWPGDFLHGGARAAGRTKPRRGFPNAAVRVWGPRKIR